jgi:ABC-type multidrug transport system permease subunit
MTALGRETFFNLKPVEQFPATPLSVYYMSSILVTALFYSGLYVGFQILKEYEQGTLLRLRTTRTLVSQFIVAKMVLITVLLTIAAAAALTVIKEKPAEMGDIMLCFSMAMLCVSFAVLLSALFRTSQRFILAGNLILFFFTILGGGIIPIQYLPQDMLQISKFTPDYYMLKEIISAYHGQAVNTVSYRLVFALLAIGMAGIAILIFGQRRVNHCEV